jgi:hypothetical protein
LFAQAVASLETGYGRLGQFAKAADQGIYNWGALTQGRQKDGQCPAGSFPGKDTDKGEVIDVCFYGFTSDLEAAKSFVKLLTGARWPGVLPAMAMGNALDVATAMKNGLINPGTKKPYEYYTAPVAGYAVGISNKLQEIAKSIPGTVIPDSRLPSPLLKTLGVFLFGSIAALGGWVAYKRHGRSRK